MDDSIQANAIVATDATPGNEIDIFSNGTSIFDVERFEMVTKVATVMARASLIPDHLKVKKTDGSLDVDATFSNCFVIANLALTWGFDPFMVAQAASLTYGKLTLEGKLVRAVIRKYLKFDFSYYFFGNAGDMERRVYVSEKPLLDGNGNPMDEPSIISSMHRGDRITQGTLERWHTKKRERDGNPGGINDNWKKDEDKMFRERGAREWCRQWAPGLILGIYTPDEFDEQSEDYRASRARNVTPATTPAANPLLDDKSSARQSMPMDTIDKNVGAEVEKVSSQRAQLRTASKSETRDESSEESTRIPEGRFRDYGKALARCASAENLPRAHESFWGVNPPRSGPDYDLARAIYGVHSERLKSGGDAAAAITAVSKLIEKDFPL